MSDSHNPLFENEKEFLEQKKLEYERALRGEVAQIKEKTVQVGKVAVAGAGLAGTVWLITRLLTGKKRKPRRFENGGTFTPAPAPEPTPPALKSKDKEKKDKKGPQDPNAPKSAAASAAVFQEVLGFDEQVGPPPAAASHEPDPFEPQPAAAVVYTPREAPKQKKRSAPARSKAHEHDGSFAKNAAGTLGTLAKAAWQSETARSLISQALAAGLASVVSHSEEKTAEKDAQTPKNPDLAGRADAAAAGAGAAGPFSSAQPSFPDASRQYPS